MANQEPFHRLLPPLSPTPSPYQEAYPLWDFGGKEEEEREDLEPGEKEVKEEEEECQEEGFSSNKLDDWPWGPWPEYTKKVLEKTVNRCYPGAQTELDIAPPSHKTTARVQEQLLISAVTSEIRRSLWWELRRTKRRMVREEEERKRKRRRID